MVSQSMPLQHSRWAVRSASFVVWALAAASAAYWGLRLSTETSLPVAAPVSAPPPPTDPAAVARLLGAAPQAEATAAAPSLASRFALVGVAARGERQGAALIAVDGKPPRPYRVGSQVDEGIVVQSVAGRRAVLAASLDGPPLVTLEMPPLAQR